MRFSFALISALALTVSAANAGTVVGINSVSNGGGLYSIDTASGLATQIYDTSSLSLGSNVNSGNSLANSGTNYYLSSFSKGVNDTLYTVSNTGVSNTAGTLVGHVASGAYSAGSYYYFTQTTGASPTIELHQVGFDASGTMIASDSTIALSGDVKAWTFGDIVVKGDTLYGVATASSGPELFSIDLTTGVVTTVSLLSTGLQLAYSGSELIGIAAATGDIYSVDTTTGALTYLSTVHTASGGSLFITDLSSTAIPEPTSLALLGIGLTGFFSFRRLLSRKVA